MRNDDMKMMNGSGESGMDNLQISNETREKLEEATVSLFMEQYAKVLDAGIDDMMEECADDEFPAELDKRIRTLIAKESAKERNAKRRKTALRVLRSAAAVFAVVMLTCGVLFVSVEAFRVPIMNFLAEAKDRYFVLRSTSKDDEFPTLFNPDDPLGNILPDEFVADEVNNNWDMGLLDASYSDNTGTKILLTVEPAQSAALIDKEDAEVNHFQINDCDAYMSKEGGELRIAWLDADAEKIFSLCGIQVTEEKLLLIAESLILLLT